MKEKNRDRFAFLIAVAMLVLTSACGTDQSSPSGGQASAHGVLSRAQLVGGDRALGDLGDIVLENEKIRLPSAAFPSRA